MRGGRDWFTTAAVPLVVVLVTIGLLVGGLIADAVVRATPGVNAQGSSAVAVEIVGITANLVVSTGLLYLYTQLRTIQNTQTQIMEAERTPRLLTSDFCVGATPPSDTAAEGLEVELINAGDGPAFRLEAYTELAVDDEQITGHSASAIVVSTDASSRGVNRDYLLPDGDSHRFCTCPKADLATPNGASVGPLCQVLSDRVEPGTPVEIHLWIEADTDLPAQPARIDLLDHTYTVGDDPTLEDVLNEATPTTQFSRRPHRR